jgi:hypothetical protein
MKKILLVLTLTLGTLVSNGQNITKWKLTGNVKLDSLMLANEAQWDYEDSLRKAGYKIEEENFGVEKSIDEYTGEITISTQIKFDGAMLHKYIRKGVTTYYLNLEAEGSTVNYSTSGVIVLFTDGTKWIKPSQKVSLNYRSGFHYSSFIRLTPADVEIFSKKFIKGYKLYIYDSKLDISEAEEFVMGVNKVKISK